MRRGQIDEVASVASEEHHAHDEQRHVDHEGADARHSDARDRHGCIDALALEVADVRCHTSDLDRRDAVDERSGELCEHRGDEGHTIGNRTHDVPCRTDVGHERCNQDRSDPLPIGVEDRAEIRLGELRDQEVHGECEADHHEDGLRLDSLEVVEFRGLGAGLGRDLLPYLLVEALLLLHGVPSRTTQRQRLDPGGCVRNGLHPDAGDRIRHSPLRSHLRCGRHDQLCDI